MSGYCDKANGDEIGMLASIVDLIAGGTYLE